MDKRLASQLEGMPGVSHTAGLYYTWPERLYYLVFRHWPQAVVDRRLEAWHRDDGALASASAAYIMGQELGVLRVLADEVRHLVRLDERGYLVMGRELATAKALTELLDRLGAE